MAWTKSFLEAGWQAGSYVCIGGSTSHWPSCACRTVDQMWRSIMKATHDAPGAIAIAREKARVDQLVECNKLLEEVQKGLAAYLEKKRCAELTYTQCILQYNGSLCACECV